MTNKSAIHIFGEVLFDHFPDSSRVLGGAPFNVAWHLQAFGYAPNFISRIGDDPSGGEITTLMTDWGMSTENVQIDQHYPTGSVKVNILDGEPHYDIVADCAYDFIDASVSDNPTTEGILYHGSLAIRNPVSSMALQALKSRHRGKIFVDVNLRLPWWTEKTLLPLLQDANWIKLNEAELYQLYQEKSNLETTMESACTQFDLDALFVTRGAQGAIACQQNRDLIAIKPSANLKIVDTVGAGDAFAAVLLMGLSENWPLATTLERAQVFAGELVGKRGATIADSNFYQMIKAQWA